MVEFSTYVFRTLGHLSAFGGACQGASGSCLRAGLGGKMGVHFHINGVEVTNANTANFTLEERTALATATTYCVGAIANHSAAYAANAAMALAQKQIVKPLDMKALEGSIAAEVQKFAEMHFPAAKLTCKAD